MIKDVALNEFLNSLEDECEIEVYTDGACSGNPGPGGWAAVIVCGELRSQISGHQADTTNNRMEMLGAIEVLKVLPKTVKLIIYTDSTYLKSGATQWIKGWMTNGWRSSSRTAVKNQDLWMELSNEMNGRDIAWVLVKGHASCAHNNMADSIARSAVVTACMKK